MALLVATTSLPAVYRPNNDARTPHARANISTVAARHTTQDGKPQTSYCMQDMLQKHAEQSDHLWKFMEQALKQNKNLMKQKRARHGCMWQHANQL